MAHFVRVAQHLVNLDRVDWVSVEPDPEGDLSLTVYLTNGDRIDLKEMSGGPTKEALLAIRDEIERASVTGAQSAVRGIYSVFGEKNEKA